MSEPGDGPPFLAPSYSGLCPATGRPLELPRTVEAERLARELVAPLELREGKMFGVLLCSDGTVLRAFSGLWDGRAHVPGWVGPIPFPTPSSTSPTLAGLARLKEELSLLPAFAPVVAAQVAELAAMNRERKLRRDEQRGLVPEAELNRESQSDWRALRELRALARAEEEQGRAAERQRVALLHQRRALSRALQAELHAGLDCSLFGAAPWSLASLFPSGPPTGVGECCAPRLLYAAAVRGLRPAGMAEIWWGRAGPRVPGRFYGPCAERCQPLMGPLLSGIRPLSVLLEQPDLLVVDKPPGVLTVPGRSRWNQDSLLERLRVRFPEALPVHRLDLETSGLVLFARNPMAQAELQRLFALRTVEKTYTAVLEGEPSCASGLLEGPIAACGSGRYAIRPDGKPARTRFQQLDGPRVLFWPQTGRSHQLRVHASSELGNPILGDPLYGTAGSRLHLHASRLRFCYGGRAVDLESPVPF